MKLSYARGSMPMFYLHLFECGDETLDSEGINRPTLADARVDAIAAARGLMRDEIAHGRLCLGCRIDIADKTGTVVMTVPFKDAVTITGA